MTTAARARAPPHETWPRLVVKAVEWRATGILLGVLIGYILTGSWRLGALLGSVYNLVRLDIMPLRDRLWNRVRWGMVESKPGFTKASYCGVSAQGIECSAKNQNGWALRPDRYP